VAAQRLAEPRLWHVDHDATRPLELVHGERRRLRAADVHACGAGVVVERHRADFILAVGAHGHRRDCRHDNDRSDPDPGLAHEHAPRAPKMVARLGGDHKFSSVPRCNQPPRASPNAFT